MISLSESKKIKSIIGSYPVVKLAKYFLDNQVLNDWGEPWSNSMIQKVLDGKRTNLGIERGISDLLDQTIKENELVVQRREEQLKELGKFEVQKELETEPENEPEQIEIPEDPQPKKLGRPPKKKAETEP